MNHRRLGGPLAPAAFEWRFLATPGDPPWRDDVETLTLDAPAIDNEALHSTFRELSALGITRVVTRSSAWADDALPRIAADHGLSVFDAEPDSSWCHEGLARPAPQPMSLDTVVINTTTHELDAVVELLRVWGEPEYGPLAPGDRPFTLVVLLNQGPGEDFRRQVTEAIAAGPLATAVTQLTFLPLNLSPQDDRYERGNQGDPGAYGFKSGPNVQFFRGLDALTGLDDFALVVETDTRPVRRGWVSAARDLMDREGDAWVLGSVYRGPERSLHHTSRSHLNGNAIYSLSEAFAAFRASCWEPVLQQFVTTHPYVAYDFALTLAMTTPQGAATAPELLANWHRFRAAEYIQNLVVWGRYDPDTVNWVPIVEGLRDDNPSTYLVHGVRGAHRPPWV